MSFIDAHGEMPKPGRWVKSADGIPASVRRFRLKANAFGENKEVCYEHKIWETGLSGNQLQSKRPDQSISARHQPDVLRMSMKPNHASFFPQVPAFMH